MAWACLFVYWRFGFEEDHDTLGEVAGHFHEQLDFVVVKGLRAGGIDVEGAEDLVFGDEGQSDGGGVAPFTGLVAPGFIIGIFEDVLVDDGFGGTDGSAGGPASPLGIGPGDIDGFEIIPFETPLGDRTDSLVFIILGQANPSESIATDIDHDETDILHESGDFGVAFEGFLALTVHLVDPIESDVRILRRNIHGLAVEVDRIVGTGHEGVLAAGRTYQ